jgi:hypothetical protein
MDAFTQSEESRTHAIQSIFTAFCLGIECRRGRKYIPGASAGALRHQKYMAGLIKLIQEIYLMEFFRRELYHS